MAAENLLNPPPLPVPRLLLDVPDACAALSICAKTLWTLTAPRGPIPAVRIGRAVRYDVRDLQKFIDGQKAGAP
jgi:hypothetical protein